MPIVNLSNKTSLYYELTGNEVEKNYLLMIPGLGGNVTAFGNILPRIKKYFNIILVENRGVGRTNLYKSPFTVFDMTADIILLMDFLNIENTNIIGHSMGGFIAQVIAAEYPDRVSRVVLSCTSASMKEETKLLLNLLYTSRKDKLISERQFNEKILRNFTSPIIYDNSFMREAMLDFMEKYKYKQTLKGFADQVNVCLNCDLEVCLEKIEAETLIIAGEKDEIVSVKDAVLLKRKISNSVLTVMNGCAHIPYVEKSGEYSDLVINFLTA